MEEIQIIENAKEAKDEYGHMCGSSTLELTKEQLQAIEDGKCVACNDGEYTTFVVLQKNSIV